MGDIDFLKGKEQFQQKLEVKFAVVAKNLGNKKVLVEHEQGQIVLHYGEGVVSFLVQNGKKTKLKLNKKERNLALHTLVYNKRNNILVTAIFESLVDKANTKIFCNICKGFNIDLNQKILLVVTKKTRSLSLLKAKHIIFTPPAMQFFSPLAMQYVQTEYSN